LNDKTGDIRTHTGTAKRPDAYKFGLANLTRRVLRLKHRAAVAFDADQMQAPCIGSANKP
jgi:hypothetical protein